VLVVTEVGGWKRSRLLFRVSSDGRDVGEEGHGGDVQSIRWAHVWVLVLAEVAWWL